jgi:phosphatidylglycerophosphatase A
LGGAKNARIYFCFMSHMPPSALDRLALLIAWALGVAKVPFLPGTAGTLLAVLLAPFCFYPLELWQRVLLLAILFAVGGWASGRAARLLGEKDPGQVVIDEVVGQWLTLLWLPELILWQHILAFFLFRLYDIKKPWFIGKSESWLSGGWGIMIDDVLAGLMAALTLQVIAAGVEYIFY